MGRGGKLTLGREVQLGCLSGVGCVVIQQQTATSERNIWGPCPHGICWDTLGARKIPNEQASCNVCLPSRYYSDTLPWNCVSAYTLLTPGACCFSFNYFSTIVMILYSQESCRYLYVEALALCICTHYL